MNGHIINCNERDFFDEFLSNGLLGVGLYIPSTTPQGLSNACKNSYSMYADMKTIRTGDIIFVHAEKKIYGAFRAESQFVEAPDIDSSFLSTNIHYHPNPEIPGSGWRGNITAIPNLGKYRKISISPYIGSDGDNLCFIDGIDANEIFDLKRRNKIFSVPERWKYPDSARTVRPIFYDEAVEILRLLHRDNSDSTARRIFEPADLTSYHNIELILNPNIVEDEKIIEGWILNNTGTNRDIDEAIGPFDGFGNNMPAGYLKHMDIFGYQLLIGRAKKYKVIEVKVGRCSFPSDINQLMGYMDWVTENIANGEYKFVEGIILTKGFDQNSIDFVENFNTLGRRVKLVEFDYNPPDYDALRINRII